MLKTLRDIATRRLHILVTSSGTSNLTSKAIFLAQLAEMGYRVSNHQDYNDSILSHLNDDAKILEQIRGGDVSYVPLFAGFPDSVPNKDSFLANRLVGLFGNWIGFIQEGDGVLLDNGMIIPNWLFDLDEFGADPISGRQDLVLLEKGVAEQAERAGDTHVEWIDLEICNEAEAESRLHAWMENCLYAKSSIKTALHPDLESCLQYFGVDKIDVSKVSFKETKSYLTGYLWDWDRFEDAASCINTPTDALRLMASLTSSDVSLSEKIKFPKLSKRQRRAVLSVIERSSNPAEDLNRYRDLWLALGRGLHPGEYKSRYPRTAKAFDTLRNKKIPSFESKVNSFISSSDIPGVISLLSTRPSVFGRKIHHILSIATPKNRGKAKTMIGKAIIAAGLDSDPKDAWKIVLDGFEKVAHQIPIKNLITLQAYFRTIEGLKHRTTINKKGKLRVYANQMGRITQACNARLNDILAAAINLAMQNKDSWAGQNVYIDKAIRDYMVPLAQRTATDGLMTLGRGSRVSIDTSKVVRLFIYWKEKERRTDLDLSAIAYDKNMKFVGQISYTNLSSGDIVHSGDITSAPYGASEFIDIPIAKVKKNMPNARYISTQTYIYSGENFFDLEECYAGWMIRDKSSKNQKSFDMKTVQTKFDVRGPGKYVIPCLLDLEEGKIIYTDLYMSGQQSYNRVENSVSDIGIVTREIARMYDTRPNMLDLAMANALGRGATIVTDPELADITFGVSDSTYNVGDLEAILSELI